jgi:tetratricopeptide (TPR) repeat protein
MLSWLSGIFKDSDNQPNWPRIGAVIVAILTGIWAVFTFVVEHKAGHEQGASKEQIEQIQKPFAEQLAAQNALIKMLLEKNPAAGPGAQQAVGAAVGSIAQGAAEGDNRLQQALDLLKANKTTEAAQLLRAFAEDKTARIDKDRKEAAIAYRNLGAIAALHDPKAAREAYARAVALDPGDAEGLSWDGWFQLQAKNLAAAERSNRTLVQPSGKGASEDQIFWARTGLGNIAKARGDLNAALAAHGEARSAMERLAASDAGNADWQRDLSVSYDRVGDVLVKQGNLPDALKSYRASLVIAERLAASDAGDADWQRDLSVSNNKIGDVLVSQGNLPDALKSYRAGLVIRERLAASDAGNADWQRDVSVSNNKIGDVLVSQGNLPDALKSYRAGLVIRERLAASDAGNADWQRDLAASFGKLALMHKQSGDSARAREFLRQGRAIMARLTKLSPDNATWKKDLDWFDGQIAELAAQKHLAQAPSRNRSPHPERR